MVHAAALVAIRLAKHVCSAGDVGRSPVKLNCRSPSAEGQPNLKGVHFRFTCNALAFPSYYPA